MTTFSFQGDFTLEGNTVGDQSSLKVLRQTTRLFEGIGPPVWGLRQARLVVLTFSDMVPDKTLEGVSLTKGGMLLTLRRLCFWNSEKKAGGRTVNKRFLRALALTCLPSHKASPQLSCSQQHPTHRAMPFFWNHALLWAYRTLTSLGFLSFSGDLLFLPSNSKCGSAWELRLLLFSDVSFSDSWFQTLPMCGQPLSI